MATKIIICLGISLCVYLLVSYINFLYNNKILKKINYGILQSTMMYFSHSEEIKEEDMDEFRGFTISRLKENKLDKWITDFSVGYLDIDKVNIKFNFLRNETDKQQISFDIKKNKNYDGQ